MLNPLAEPVSASAGRSCPLHYRYSPAVFAPPAQHRCEVLYVVGGLYGNGPALESVLRLFAREAGPKRLVFNGDFNWFNVDSAAFERVNQTVLAFDATRGNVETELAASRPTDNAQQGDAGCGCAYPDWVADEVVSRSNQIMQRLNQTAAQHPALQQKLAALPMWLTFEVGASKIAIVHGDAESLAGWGFAQEMLRQPAHQPRLHGWFDAAKVDVFACSHTCLPLFHRLPARGDAAARWVLNNGAAGMPNFAGDSAGLLTRIAVRPFAGPERRHGFVNQGLHVDALAVDIDTARWTAQFLRQWPPGSTAHASYWQRIVAGPAYGASDALPHDEAGPGADSGADSGADVRLRAHHSAAPSTTNCTTASGQGTL